MTGIGSSSWSWKEAMFEVPCGGWLVGGGGGKGRKVERKSKERRSRKEVEGTERGGCGRSGIVVLVVW